LPFLNQNPIKNADEIVFRCILSVDGVRKYFGLEARRGFFALSVSKTNPKQIETKRQKMKNLVAN
jgi:hypothetical protein